MCLSVRDGLRCAETVHGVLQGSTVHVAYKVDGRIALMWIDQSTPHRIA